MRWLIGLISVGMPAHAAMRLDTYRHTTLEEGTNGIIMHCVIWRQVIITR